jgi:aminoglycoside phosphotransferase (APT) family kinase protein
VNGEWIFRFPKRESTQGFLAVETALLPRLAPALPLPIPAPRYDGAPGEDFPFRFMGYRRLPGVPAILLPLDAVDLGACGRQLGEFLTSLHGFSVEEAARSGAREQPDPDCFERWRRRTRERWPEIGPCLPPSLARRASAYLDGRLPSAWDGPVRLVHYDLGAAHVLVDRPSRRVCGILDWGDVQLGDPAIDFAGLAEWQGLPLVERALDAYGGPAPDPAFLDRVRAGAAFASFSALWYGVRGGRPEWAASGLRSLERLLG